MNIQELYSFITHLLRSEPEVIAAFFMGTILTAMLALTARRWLPPAHEPSVEVARKDAEIARKESELARKDAQIAALESRWANLEGQLLEEEKFSVILRRQNATSVASSREDGSVGERWAELEASCARLEAENARLNHDRLSIEADAARLRRELAQAIDEAQHWAKWSKVFDDENARLAEIGPLTEC